MIYGNWVPIHKGFVKFLPVDRPYGEHEAMLSLSVDYDNNRPVSVVGYASLWQWSRTKVKSFFVRYGIEIVYKNDTKKMQKQKGQIKKQKEDRRETEKGQIRFVDSKASQVQKDRKKTEERQKKSRRKDTTIDPNINPNPKTNKHSKEFEEVWKITPKRNGTKQGKKSASNLFEKLDIDDKRKVYKGLSNYSNFLKTVEQSAMDLERFIRNRFFDDYQEEIRKDNDGNSQAEELKKKTQELLNDR